MVIKQMNPQLWCISAVEDSFRGFYGDSYTEHGMMYNAFVLETEEKIILLGTLPKRYVAPWLTCVQKIAKERKVGWLVLFGAPDDRDAVNAVLQAYPEAILVGGAAALYQLEGFVEGEAAVIPIRGKRAFAFSGKKLIFQTLPGGKDTSTVSVIDAAEKTLFSGDLFGANYADKAVTTGEIADWERYLHGVSQHYKDISGLTRVMTMESAVALVREQGIQTICPCVGPVVEDRLEDVLKVYEPIPMQKNAALEVSLLYRPGGYVEELMSCAAAGIQDSGNVKAVKIDLSETGREIAVQKAGCADALLLGTTNEMGNTKAIWDVLTSLTDGECRGKIAAAVYSVPARDCNVRPMQSYLASREFDRTIQDLVVPGKPDAQVLKNAYEYGFALGCRLQKIPNPHKPTLVKCLVCGEIFDASLGTCPVCGVGLEQCVPVDENEVSFRKNTDHRYLILGGGIAAVSAAEAIRSRDETGSITLLSAENYLPINRPMLTKDLALISDDPDAIRIHDPQWYQERKLTLKLGVRAVSLDTAAKTVTASDGVTYPYDKLIYATGAECFVPPFEGHDKKGVLTLRHLWDSRELQQYMKTAKKAVIIGGGVLGLEAASELMRSGLQVTVLEATPQIIGRQVDARSAAILKQRMEALQVACFEGVSIAGIEGTDRATGVRLADGRVFPADFVVVSCGNRGNVQVAQAAGIAVERAIVVNQRMETSAPDVYACGDCCQFEGINYQLWQEASDQGRTAGANAAGEAAAYANRPMGLSLEGFGTSLFAMGDPGKKPDVPYQTVETTDNVTGRHETYWFYGGSLQGAVVIGAPEKTADITQAVTTHARYHELF